MPERDDPDPPSSLGTPAAPGEPSAELEALRSSVARTPVPVLVFDVDTLEIVIANDAAAALYGWSVDELRSMSMLDIRPQEDAPEFLDVARDVIRPAGLGSIAMEITLRRRRHVRRDGGVLFVDIRSSAVEVDGRVLRLTYLHDESPRVQAEIERDRSMHRLIEEQEHLHNEIAERLHDGPVQTLTAASLRIGLLRRTVDAAMEPKLAEIERLVIDALHALRREMDDQRAPLDIAADFAGSIRSVLERFGLQDHYLVRASGGEPPASIGALVYRVVMSVLSTTSLGADVDDPWIIDLSVAPDAVSVQIPVAPRTDTAAQLAAWIAAMGGVVRREAFDDHDLLCLTIRVPPSLGGEEAT